jgi:hypothetical protein
MTDALVGVPFMITSAMKAALGVRGFSDADIEQIAPDEAHRILSTPDPAEVRAFLETFVALAAKSLNGYLPPGVIQICRLHPSDKKIVASRYEFDDVDGMISAAVAASESGQNVYIEGRFVPSSLRGRGKFEDTLCVFALVIDSDVDKNMAWSPPPGVKPTMIVETSAGNRHYWFFFREALERVEARKLGERIRKATKGDSDTGNPAQPYRIAGTVNYPNAAKVGRGRVITWTRLISCDPDAFWTPEGIEAAFHLKSAPRPSGGAQGAQGGTPAGDIDVDAPNFVADLREAIVDGAAAGYRSDVFYWIVKGLRSEGYAVDQIFECFCRYPGGIASKYLNPAESGSPQRLRDNIQAVYDKKPQPRNWSAGLADVLARVEVNLASSGAPGASGGTSAPGGAPVSPNLSGSPGAVPGASSTPPVSPAAALADAHTAFRYWLGPTYELDVLDAVLATAAADRLGGDPLWLMVISGSGNAKTETVQALSGAGAHVTSTITSEGALLSATRRSHGATGGLLFKIGPRGLLVIKDFTSILSAGRDVRNTVLAALREVHDGRWERNVGFAGGRTLTWRGRLTIVSACTTAWDTAHKVIAVMGDRFALKRADSTVGRIEAARQAMDNIGKEDAMRAELAAVVGVVVANVDMNVRGLDVHERARLIALADIVTWTRTGIERDYRGDVVDAHASEMPTRFGKQLAQLMRGALAIGIEPGMAMRLANLCARDSIEPRRFLILQDVALHPGSVPEEVARRVVRPLTTVKNDLVALYTLRLLTCVEHDQYGVVGRLLPKPHYSLAPGVDRNTLLSM